jgi:hypothetical protein
VIAAIVLLAGAPARAAEFVSPERALAEAFPAARVVARSYVLTDAQVAAVRARAQVRVDSKLATSYVAWRGDTLAGVGFFDTRIVRTMPGVFLVVVAPDTTVARVDIVAFHEPPDYRPTPRWLGLFPRHRLDDRLWPRRDIRNLSGATLSARAVTESVRLALAQYEILVAPEIQRGAAPIRGDSIASGAPR